MSDEPTVATPGGDRSDQPEEATVALPGAAAEASLTKADKSEISDGADEATVAFSGSTPVDDEKTAVLSEPAEAGKAAPVGKAAAAGAAAAAGKATETAKVTAPVKAVGTAGSADEATTVLSPTGTDDEAITVIPASSRADTAEEATTVMPAGAAAQPPEENTVALPAADRIIALPATRPTPAPAADRTIALPPTPAPAADRTVALPTAAAPAADHTIALPPSGPASAPAAAPARTPLLTRRRLIVGLTGAAGAALAATAIHAATGDSTPEAGKPIPAQSSARTRPREPESAPVKPTPLPVQRKPISTLAEYAKASGAAPFPSDAIALTIDDGPHPVWTPKILKLLDQYQVPAMFCMIGNQVLGHEEVAKMVTTAGHQLANHTWSHPTKLGEKPSRVARKEIEQAQLKINRTTGYTPKLFRSPGGDWSPQLLHDVAMAGLLPLDWSVDPRDWTMPGVPTIEKKLLAAHPGQILLCHDGGGDRSQTFQSLSVVIPALKARGLKFVAL